MALGQITLQGCQLNPRVDALRFNFRQIQLTSQVQFARVQLGLTNQQDRRLLIRCRRCRALLAKFFDLLTGVGSQLGQFRFALAATFDLGLPLGQFLASFGQPRLELRQLLFDFRKLIRR